MAANSDGDSHARPTAPLQTKSFRDSRPDIVGPDDPQPPFPILISGPVQHGFGRGSKELGIPTANLPDESLPPMGAVETGVYFGFAQVIPTEAGGLPDEDKKVHPMVMSLGWNPFYKNERLTAEVHVMHEFASDFYGQELKAVVLGRIRPELDYTSREALIEDIEMDKRVALKSLARQGYQRFAAGDWTEYHLSGEQ